MGNLYKYNNFKIRQFNNDNLHIHPYFDDCVEEIKENESLMYQVNLILNEEHYIYQVVINGYTYLQTENQRLYQIGLWCMSTEIEDYFDRMLQGEKVDTILYPIPKREAKQLLIDLENGY